MGFALKDTQVKGTRALPSAASTTVDGAAIDLGHSSLGDFRADVEFLLTAPALTTTQLPNASTMKYSIIHSDNSDLSSPTVIAGDVITQTGAGGAGASAATFTWRPNVDVKRYIGVRVVSGASVTDSSSKTATFEGMF